MQFNGWMEDFLNLRDNGSFSRAADLRSTSQPAFSRRIQALEHWIGAPLFDRSGKTIELTEAGRMLAPLVERTTRELEQLRAEARKTREVSALSLRVAATHTLSTHFLPEWIEALEKHCPVSSIRLISDSFQNCREHLLHGGVDILVTHESPGGGGLDSRQFQRRVIGKDRLVAVARPEKCTSGGSVETAGETRTPNPSLSYEVGSAFRDALSDVLPTASGKAACFTSQQAAVLKRLVCAGKGYAWLPETIVWEELNSGSLARVFDSGSDIPLDIAIYRKQADNRPLLCEIWSKPYWPQPLSESG